MKKTVLLLLPLIAVTLLIGGCRVRAIQPDRMTAEDIEVLTKYSREIAVLHSDLPPNSEAKYLAAKKLNQEVDFSFVREVQTLDKIFSSVDARVDNPNSADQMLMFYYQYKDKSIRFLFYRYMDHVTRVEIIEK